MTKPKREPPYWFQLWLANHWKHLNMKVNGMLWLVAVIMAAVIAGVVQGFLGD